MNTRRYMFYIRGHKNIKKRNLKHIKLKPACIQYIHFIQNSPNLQIVNGYIRKLKQIPVILVNLSRCFVIIVQNIIAPIVHRRERWSFVFWGPSWWCPNKDCTLKFSNNPIKIHVSRRVNGIDEPLDFHLFYYFIMHVGASIEKL